MLFARLGSSSSPVTVASFVRHCALAGAVAVTVIVNVAPLASAPSAHMTSLPLTEQPGVVVFTFVNALGTVSWTEKPELLPGPWFVTVSVHVTAPPVMTVAGPVLTIPRSTFSLAMHAAPSLLCVGDGAGVVGQQREGRSGGGFDFDLEDAPRWRCWRSRDCRC